MPEPKTVLVKYIFLDVVKYSKDRSVEAQTEIIATLNDIVRSSAKEVSMSDEKTIYLPTGDGICVAHFNSEAQFDIHLQFALKLLERLNAYNSNTTDPLRQFHIRVGINANVDNLVVDINGKQNFAGAGINLAQRVMNVADGNQILVSDTVFDTLRYREKYIKSFKSFTASTKHNQPYAVHQFIDSSPGLDNSTPSLFEVADREDEKLTKFAAYYFAHAIANRKFLAPITKRDDGQTVYSATVLLALLADDSVGNSEATDIRPYKAHVWWAGKASFSEQLQYYNKQDFWVISELSDFAVGRLLRPYLKFFAPSFSVFSFHFITEEGQEKLKREWPGIWTEFHLETSE